MAYRALCIYGHRGGGLSGYAALIYGVDDN